MGLGDFWGGGLGLDLPSSRGVGAEGFDNFSASLTKRATLWLHKRLRGSYVGYFSRVLKLNWSSE